MFNFLQSIFRASPGAAADDRLIHAAIERVVDGTDPRLRAARSYRRILRPQVARAVEHVIALTDALPPCVEISGRRFGSDALLQAFFVSVDHLRATVSYSEDLENYLAGPPMLPGDNIYCLLTLDRSEKRVLGMAMHGDTISRDVAQTVVNFSNHRLVGLAADEAEMRNELRKHAFDQLIGVALADLSAARDQAGGLERRQRILQRKLVAMQAAGWVGTLLEPAVPGAARSPDDVQRELVGIEAELAAQESDAATLDGQLAHVARTLAQPERHLRIEKTQLTLDAMGIRLEASAAQGLPALELLEVVSGDRRRALLPGYLVRAELLPRRDYLSEARRRLSGGA